MPGYQDDIDKECWYAFYTKPRQELRAKEQFMNQGLAVFLPMIPAQKKISDPKFYFLATCSLKQIWPK